MNVIYHAMHYLSLLIKLKPCLIWKWIELPLKKLPIPGKVEVIMMINIATKDVTSEI